MSHDFSYSAEKKNYTSPGTTLRRVITSSDDFILYGKTVFESLIHSAEPSVQFHWLHEEGKFIYHGQNIVSFKVNNQLLLQPVFQSALQLLSYLSGLATLTHYYVVTVKKSQQDKDKKQTVFVKKNEFSKWSQWESKAIQQGGGEVISSYMEDSLIHDISHFDNVTKPRVLICRHLETARQLLNSKHKSNFLFAFPYTARWQGLINSIPFNQQIGIWGNISCQEIKDIYHPRLDFILPDSLSYPPLVDLFIKCP